MNFKNIFDALASALVKTKQTNIPNTDDDFYIKLSSEFYDLERFDDIYEVAAKQAAEKYYTIYSTEAQAFIIKYFKAAKGFGSFDKNDNLEEILNAAVNSNDALNNVRVANESSRKTKSL